MNKKKRIVIIMYNFPPIGAGRGIAWAYFADVLAEEYDVNIITIKPSLYDPIYNEAKLDLITDSYKVHRTYPGSFYSALYNGLNTNNKVERTNSKKNRYLSIGKSLYKKVFRTFMFPDRMIFWNKYAMEEFAKLNSEKEVSLLITVGFPFSSHMVGNKIKKRFGVKLILDYGDPWSFNPSNETIPSWRKFVDRFVEKKIVKKADFITVTTRKTEEEFIKRFNLSKNKIEIIPQGVDTQQYNFEYTKYSKRTNEKKFPKNKLVLFYSGLFYKDIRNPSKFFKALSHLTPESLGDLEIDIVIAGNMEDYVLNLIENLSFCSQLNIKFIGNVGFDEVIQYQVGCDGLLFFGNNGSVQVPGKLYEYIAARKPLFAIAPTYDEACEIIDGLNRGIVVQDDVDIIKNKLIEFIKKINSHNNPFNLEKVDYYDWSYIGDKYKNIIKTMLRGN